MDDIDGEIGHTLGLSIEFYENGQHDEAISYGTVCLQMAIENCNEDAEMNACLVIGQSELALRDYDNAIFHCMTSLDIAKKKLDQVVEMKSCLALADAQCVLENYDEALMYAWRSLHLAKEIDVHYEAKACLVLAETYSALGKYDKVISFGRRAHSISQMTSSGKDRHVEMRSCLVVACAFRTLGNYNEAIEYACRCIDIAKYKFADKYVEIYACLFLTQSYEDLGENDNTLLFASMLLFLAKEIDDKENQKKACVFIMETYRSLKQHNEAVQYAKMHIKLVKETGDKQAEMETDVFIADTQFHARNYNEAVKYALMCIDVAKQIGDKRSEIYACVLIGMASRPLKSYLDIIEYAKQCIENENDDHGNKKIGFFLLGFVDANLKKYPNAVSNFRKAAYHAKEEGDEYGEITIRLNLGEAYLLLNKLDDAISCFKSSFQTAKKIADIKFQMTCSLKLSDLYAMLNRNDEVEVYATTALGIAKELDDKEGLKKATMFLGNVYKKSNRESEATALLKECAEMSKESGDGLTELCASVMVPALSLSDAEKRMDEGQEILNRFSMPQPNTLYCIETTLSYICQIHDSLMSAVKVHPTLQFAREGMNYVMQHLEIQKRFQCSVQPLIHSMEELIQALPLKDEEEAAMRKLLQSLPELQHSGKPPQSFEEYLVHMTKSFDAVLSMLDNFSSIPSYLPAIFHSCNGITHYLLQDASNAKASCNRAIGCFESLFDSLHDVDNSKISVVDKYGDTYKLLSKILIEEGNTKEALLVAERCRAKALKDILVLEHGLNKEVMQEGHIEVDDIWPVLKTLRLSVLFYTVSFTEIHKFAMKDEKSLHLSVQPVDLQVWMLKKLIKEVYEELNVTSAFRCERAQWPCSLAQALKSDENKEVGEKMVQHFSSLGMIPGACDWNDVNEDVKEEIWNELARFFDDPGNTKAKGTSGQESMLSAQMILDASAGVPLSTSGSAIETLSVMLLGNVPLEKDELVIIPDDLLSIVPFAALTNPATGRYLSEDKKIRFAPSLTTLKVLSESREDFHTLKGAILIGDPDVGNVLYNDVEITVSRLEGALLEAKMIADKFRVSPLTGAHATKQAVLKKLREGASVVHIAAHGSLDKATIYLAPVPEVRAVRIPNEEDYMLTMAEVQQAQVRAQLVVLSCCYSGRGQIRAEGVVGMCRAFLASGARAVVASLWAVDDQATLDFMLEFYGYLQDGESASTSLQMAMEEMRHTYKEPKYWAPFFLMGDDVKITF